MLISILIALVALVLLASLMVAQKCCKPTAMHDCPLCGVHTLFSHSLCWTCYQEATVGRAFLHWRPFLPTAAHVLRIWASYRVIGITP
jgi:hypothetical protein